MNQTIQLGLLSAINIGIGFLYQWFVLIQLGPGMETDALFAGMALPQMVLAVVSGSLMHVLVPLLAGEKKNKLHADAWGFLVLVGGLFGLIAVVFYLTANWWVPFLVPGFNNESRLLTISLTRIQLIGMIFAAINGVQWATYHAEQRFIWAEITPIIASSFGLLLLIWALPRYGVTAAAWISVFRMALQTILLSPGMGKPVWPDFKSHSILIGLKRIKPLLLGSVYYKTDPLVDRYLLSSSSSGSLSLYYLAQQLYGAVGQVLNKSIAAPLVPLFSQLYKTGNYSQFKKMYFFKLFQSGVIGVAGIISLGLCGELMLNILFGHGNINNEKIKELWWIMLLLGGVFVGGTISLITSSAFYAIGDTVTIVKISIISYTVFLILKIVAYYYYGINGLALATSIYYLSNLLIQTYIIGKKFNHELSK